MANAKGAGKTAAQPLPAENLKSLRGIKVFSGNANRPLAEDICKYLGLTLGKSHVGRFADGEINVQIEENVRGQDCYVVQPTCRPTNENLMELLIMVDALRRASAARITAVVPYFGYARADRKTAPRVPISSKLVANLIVTAGANRVITMDLHASQIQGFFDIPVDHLYAAPIVLDYVKKKALKDLVVVSPDVGGVERARAARHHRQAPPAPQRGLGLQHHRRRRGEDLHHPRRHGGHRRHPLQGRGQDPREGRQEGVRGLRARRAVGRRARAHRQVVPRGDDPHRFDPGPCLGRGEADGLVHRAVDGRGDRAQSSGQVHQRAVRLITTGE
jgi:hypothetical protein